jgi:DNA-binding XRE family transcriptional regulator
MKKGKKQPNEKLISARLQQMWSQEEAARRIGVDKKTYCNWENGRQEPQIRCLKQLCEAFGGSADELGYGHLVLPPGKRVEPALDGGDK